MSAASTPSIRLAWVWTTLLFLACSPKEEDTAVVAFTEEDPSACFHRALPHATGSPAVVGTTSFASADDRAPCAQSAGPDLRYLWRPDTDGTYRIHTSGTSFDTVLYVFEGCTRREVACNDDYLDLQSQVAVEATAGATYVIVVDGYERTDSGPFVLSVQ